MKPNTIKSFIVQFIGLALMGNGLLVLIGYMLGIQKLITWNAPIGMAASTACSFIGVGVAFWLIGQYKE